MKIGEKIHALRVQKGLTQDELASQINVSRTLIAKYESGAAYPTEENRAALAVALGTSETELVNDEEEAVPQQEKSRLSVSAIVQSAVIMAISAVGVVFVFLSIFEGHEYIYGQVSSYIYYEPTRVSFVTSIYSATIGRGNPIAVFVLIFLAASIVMSILRLAKAPFMANKWWKIAHWSTFAVSLILFFVSVICCISYIS